MRTNPRRQPKGIPAGGEFAPDPTRCDASDLDVEPEPPADGSPRAMADPGPDDVLNGADMPRPADRDELDARMETLASRLRGLSRDDLPSGTPIYVLNDVEIPAKTVENMGERNLNRFGAWYYDADAALVDHWDDDEWTAGAFADGVADGDGFYYTEKE